HQLTAQRIGVKKDEGDTNQRPADAKDHAIMPQGPSQEPAIARGHPGQSPLGGVDEKGHEEIAVEGPVSQVAKARQYKANREIRQSRPGPSPRPERLSVYSGRPPPNPAQTANRRPARPQTLPTPPRRVPGATPRPAGRRCPRAGENRR